MRTSLLVGHRRVQSRVKSVSRGTITIPVDQTSATATIPAVVLSNARLFFLGHTTTTGNVVSSAGFARVALTNTTTVTAHRQDSDPTDTVTLSYLVMEYWPGVIRSITRGTIVATNTGAIAIVDLERAGLDYLGFTHAAAANPDAALCQELPRLTFASSTSVSGDSATANATVGFQAFCE